ncbi:hypothetical protein K474DRAFT_1660926 [Panus rudis PR-1116 ss-1]|nr:hypothetical protein K474DRAFT_1660926 [Panus rudis PR-1116 ss-1]
MSIPILILSLVLLVVVFLFPFELLSYVHPVHVTRILLTPKGFFLHMNVQGEE